MDADPMTLGLAGLRQHDPTDAVLTARLGSVDVDRGREPEHPLGAVEAFALERLLPLVAGLLALGDDPEVAVGGLEFDFLRTVAREVREDDHVLIRLVDIDHRDLGDVPGLGRPRGRHRRRDLGLLGLLDARTELPHLLLALRDGRDPLGLRLELLARLSEGLPGLLATWRLLDSALWRLLSLDRCDGLLPRLDPLLAPLWLTLSWLRTLLGRLGLPRLESLLDRLSLSRLVSPLELLCLSRLESLLDRLGLALEGLPRLEAWLHRLVLPRHARLQPRLAPGLLLAGLAGLLGRLPARLSLRSEG